jgi:iron complex outermembrane receptor protein
LPLPLFKQAEQMRTYFLLIISLVTGLNLHAQDLSDSADVLEKVVIRAFDHNRRNIEVPASVSVLRQKELQRFNNTSLVPAINTQAGVRMEERSPGSYRLNIRGSSLRSPFGVRNVKIYYDGIPFTDPSGGTYLNALGFYSIGSLEILKGPAGSMYGAGTGGVMLIGAPTGNASEFSVMGGSYGLMNYQGVVSFGDSSLRNRIGFQQLKSDGYRDHSAVDRKVFQWSLNANAGRGRLSAHVLYTDLYYQTPGGLTATEFKNNPRSARPATAVFPSAQDADASIHSRNAFAGISYEQDLNAYWSFNGSLYGAYSSIVNPTFRNYERRLEPHGGARTSVRYDREYDKMKVNWTTGAELQQGIFNVRVGRNINGQQGETQTNDDLETWQYFVFSQLRMDFQKNWSVEAGLSWNRSGISITRVSAVPVTEQERRFNNQVAPRVALIKKIGEDQSVFVSVSKGFSPPTSSEVLPSTGEINTALEAETGWNYEAGYKASLMNGRWSLSASVFNMNLKNTIAQRRDAGGGDFFVNAGETEQRGLELQTSFTAVRKDHGFIRGLLVWGSYSWQGLKYKDYLRDTISLKGNRLPGIAPHTWSAGADLQFGKGLYARLNWNYSDNIFLNDQNTVKAGAYHTLNARLGYGLNLKKVTIDLFTAVENMTDTEYSLGNDINAAGGRYFNLAPGRIWSLGISLKR